MLRVVVTSFIWVLVTVTSAMACVDATERTRVTAVYPTANELPENLLRFYIYFSRPMKREGLLSSIRLVDHGGQTVTGAFLDNKFDLWSPDSQRLTLLFDPGRVKTGLVAHDTLGRALQANQHYELIIDATAHDLEGCPLAASHHKTFRVTIADDQAPDVEQWRLLTPRSHTRDALSVVLNGVHDHVSLAYRIRVKDVDKRIVPGRIDVADAEQRWQFVPERPWQPQSYLLTIDPRLEDIAGNRMTSLFDRPLESGTSASQVGLVAIPF